MTPEVQFVSISRADGGLSIMQFVTKGLLNESVVFEREASDENIADEIAKAQIDAVEWRRIGPDEVPADRTFRNAWKDDGKALGVDLPKARDIHRERLRTLRAPLLTALDAEFQRSYKDPAAMDAIEAKKQALRDVTADPAIEAAKTPEDLKAVLPAALSRNPTEAVSASSSVRRRS